jgi:hypothetical protein
LFVLPSKVVKHAAIDILNDPAGRYARVFDVASFTGALEESLPAAEFAEIARAAILRWALLPEKSG